MKDHLSTNDKFIYKNGKRFLKRQIPPREKYRNESKMHKKYPINSLKVQEIAINTHPYIDNRFQGLYNNNIS